MLSHLYPRLSFTQTVPPAGDTPMQGAHPGGACDAENIFNTCPRPLSPTQCLLLATPPRRELIQEAQAMGLGVGIASSGAPQKIQHNLSSSGLLGLVEPQYVISASQVAKVRITSGTSCCKDGSLQHLSASFWCALPRLDFDCTS